MSNIKPGTVSDFANSMAEAMENALSLEYKNVKGEPMPEKPDQDRHLLFVAIAQGVVRYLKDNMDAFTIEVETEQSYPLDPALESESSSGTIVVTQVDDEDSNLIKSSGTATVTDIQTTGTLY